GGNPPPRTGAFRNSGNVPLPSPAPVSPKHRGYRHAPRRAIAAGSQESFMGILEGQVALVTGAGRGFGRAIAERFAAEGAAVALLARSLAQLDEVAQAIRDRGGHAIGIRCDVADQASIVHAMTKARELLGPIDLLVNNAGVPGPFGPIWEVDPHEWWRAQAIHIRAPMLFMHHVLPGMVERDRGRVICVSAIASRIVAPHLSAYSTGNIAPNLFVAASPAARS